MNLLLGKIRRIPTKKTEASVVRNSKDLFEFRVRSKSLNASTYIWDIEDFPLREVSFTNFFIDNQYLIVT